MTGHRPSLVVVDDEQGILDLVSPVRPQGRLRRDCVLGRA